MTVLKTWKWLVAMPAGLFCLATLPVAHPALAGDPAQITIRTKSSPPRTEPNPNSNSDRMSGGNNGGGKSSCPPNTHWDPKLKTCLPDGGGHPAP